MLKEIVFVSRDEDTIEVQESPYGDAGTTYTGYLGMLNHFRLQLVSFRELPKTKKELEYLNRDIAGYDMILASNNENNAEEFIVRKSEARKFGSKYADNLAVIEAIKADGKWKE
jgi:hypothetical protein